MYATGEVYECISVEKKVQEVVKLPTVELQGEAGIGRE